jgi:hypothetical protein
MDVVGKKGRKSTLIVGLLITKPTKQSVKNRKLE